MPLTVEQVKSLEQSKSSYGCGNLKCHACSPIQYSCEWCGEDFPEPIANSEVFTCPECEWVNNKADAE